MFTVHSLECCVHKHCCCLCSAHTALTYFLLWKICCSDSEGEAAVCKPPFSSDWLLEVEEYNRDYKKSCKVFSQITNSSAKLSSRSGFFTWWPRSRGIQTIGSINHGSQNTLKRNNILKASQERTSQVSKSNPESEQRLPRENEERWNKFRLALLTKDNI